MRVALTMLYLAMTSFVGTSLVLAFDVVLGSRLVALPTLLAVVGVALMLASSINLAFEAHRALGSNRLEVRFHRDLQARRHADREREATPPRDV